jgi:cytochrome b involved in lipid metabolism
LRESDLQTYVATTALSPVLADSASSKGAKRIEPQQGVAGSDVPDDVHSNVPDVVHSKTTGEKKGKRVSVKDVLDHKEGEEVWVVIKGDVYK